MKTTAKTIGAALALLLFALIVAPTVLRADPDDCYTGSYDPVAWYADAASVPQQSEDTYCGGPNQCPDGTRITDFAGMTATQQAQLSDAIRLFGGREPDALAVCRFYDFSRGDGAPNNEEIP